ncbi:hypothetical protein [Piscinibacter sakaiensis]|uniref:hypothetical protein n=1 Tax=Piscinibacter sakaiensis TaxID=1547922 RepID=UPI003AAAF80E
MFIKIINFRRASPRLPRDLSRLFRYLFRPKPDAPDERDRMLGPPELHHLVLTSSPWGDEVPSAAQELAYQYLDYCKEATVDRLMPDPWYVHMIFSFASWASGDLRTPPDDNLSVPRFASSSGNAIRIAKDALDFLGWEDAQPSTFVVHADREHIHVHAVIAIPIYDGKDWDILRLSRGRLFEAAQICSDAFKLPVDTSYLRRKYAHWSRVTNGTEEPSLSESV